MDRTSDVEGQEELGQLRDVQRLVVNRVWRVRPAVAIVIISDDVKAFVNQDAFHGVPMCDAIMEAMHQDYLD